MNSAIRNMIPTRLCTAMHEAGHAIAQLANPPYSRIESIEIRGRSESILGIVNTDAMWQPYMAGQPAPPEVIEMWRQLAWKDVVAYLAGPIAELRWRKYSRADVLLYGDWNAADHCFCDPAPEKGSDFGRVRARLSWAYPDEERGALVRAWGESEELVAKHWPKIKAMGRLLCERGRLSDEEVLTAWAALQ